jgi:predicted ATP-grasp superfamily ATP-dependent carboligase
VPSIDSIPTFIVCIVADPISKVDPKEHSLVVYMLIARNIDAIREQLISEAEQQEMNLSSSSDEEEDITQAVNRMERLVVLAVGKVPQMDTTKTIPGEAKSMVCKVIKVCNNNNNNVNNNNVNNNLNST